MTRRATPPIMKLDRLADAPVLPSQWQAMHGKTLWTGERRLLLAVLETALLEYAQTFRIRWDLRARRQRQEVEAWFRSDDETWPCAFVNCCYAVGLEPSAVRARLDLGPVEIPKEGRPPLRRLRA